MKRTIALILVGLMLPLVAAAGNMTPQDLIDAVDQMSSEQVVTLWQKLESKAWQPLPEGFWTRLAFKFSGSGTSFDDVGVNDLSLSGGHMCIDDAGGSEFALLWQAFSPKLHLGLELGSWYAEDSNLSDAGYSRAELKGGYGAFVVSYQLIRARRALIWTDLSLGGGGVEVVAIDTPTGQPTTLHIYDGGFALANLRIGAAWRANPILTLFVSGGYRFAESVDLEEGGEESDIELDASGGMGQIGLGFNF